MAVIAKVSAKVGDIVRCQYFNTPDNQFYGEKWEAKVLKIGLHAFGSHTLMGIWVEPLDRKEHPSPVWLQQREIRAIIKRGG